MRVVISLKLNPMDVKMSVIISLTMLFLRPNIGRTKQEYRLILENNSGKLNEKDHRKLTYDFNSLKGIIFGIRTSTEDKMKIIDLIEKKEKSVTETIRLISHTFKRITPPKTVIFISGGYGYDRKETVPLNSPMLYAMRQFEYQLP